MDRVILDTSVVLKWFESTDEPNLNSANDILQQIIAHKLSFVVPELLTYELINTLFLSKKLSAKLIAGAISSFHQLRPECVTLTADIEKEIISLMDKYPLTAYDASFVALANLTRLPLISADTKHHKQSYSKYIVQLQNFAFPS